MLGEEGKRDEKPLKNIKVHCINAFLFWVSSMSLVKQEFIRSRRVLGMNILQRYNCKHLLLLLCFAWFSLFNFLCFLFQLKSFNFLSKSLFGVLLGKRSFKMVYVCYQLELLKLVNYKQ